MDTVACNLCGAYTYYPCWDWCPCDADNDWEMTEDELSEYADSQWEHVCVIQETPDGMGCVTCLYC